MGAALVVVGLHLWEHHPPECLLWGSTRTASTVVYVWGCLLVCGGALAVMVCSGSIRVWVEVVEVGRKADAVVAGVETARMVVC